MRKRGRSMGPCKTAHFAAGPGESGVIALLGPPGRRLCTGSHHNSPVATRWLSKRVTGLGRLGNVNAPGLGRSPEVW